MMSRNAFQSSYFVILTFYRLWILHHFRFDWNGILFDICGSFLVHFTDTFPV